MTTALVVLERERGAISPLSLPALAFGRTFAPEEGIRLEAIVLPPEAGDLPGVLPRHGVARVYRPAHHGLEAYPPEEQVPQQFADDDAQTLTPQGTNQSGAQLFALQWNMNVIRAPAAWQATPAGQGRLVRILDTGVDPDHIDLSGRIAFGKSTSFVAAEPTIQDFNTHGTFVSSIVSSNGVRIASVASDAPLCAIKVLGPNGSGSFGSVIDGILFAANEGADASAVSTTFHTPIAALSIGLARLSFTWLRRLENCSGGGRSGA